MSYAQAIREQIVTARKARGWTQTTLAERAGIKQSTVSRIESTTRGIDVDEFVAIATVLGLNAGDMLPNSAGLISRDIKPLIETLKQLEPAVRDRTLRIVEEIAGVQRDLQQSPLRTAEVLTFPQPERTRPRRTEEFPIDPESFVERDFDYPLELHALEVEEGEYAAGRTGIASDTEFEMAYTLHSREVRDATHRVIKVRGDSMSPKIEDGDKVLVDVKKSNPRPGDVVAVYLLDPVNEGGIIGYWEPTQDGVQIEKANPAYKPVKLGDPSTWKLIGVVQKRVDSPVKPRERKKR